MSIPTVQVTCVAYDQNGNPVAGGTFRFKLDRTEIYNGFVVPEVVEGTANAQGVCVVNLWPNALGTNSSQYRVQAYNPDTGAKYLDAFAVIPNSNCYLQDVIQIPPYPPIDQSQQAMIAAQAAASAAAAEADLAAADADAAALSAAAAAASATAAANSATAAANSATSASGSASTATTAAQSAQTSAGTATTKASEASTSATNAAASASSASTSTTTATNQATSATNSATAAANSATSAANSASTATTKASEAAASAAAASSSATSASASAATATTKATEAQTSASQAATSASNAASSASQAATSATAAASSASTASSAATTATDAATTATGAASTATTQANAAAASASSAAASAGAANTSANNASGSADAAEAAQIAAEQARDQTLAAFDNFDDRYLGPKSTDPTTDNDGNPLVSGALYYNTNPLNSGGGMKVYDGTAWLAAYASLSGALLSANNLSDLASASAARVNLGLGNVENKSAATILSELTSANVTTALGFTPYDAANPAGYVSQAGARAAISVAGSLAYDPVTGVITYNQPTNVSAFSNDAGYLTGINSSQVTTALGYTPYNATNPSGYVDQAGARSAISASGSLSYDSATGVISYTQPANVSAFTNDAGYLTAITGTQVITALGYTPYDATNPSGYITSSALSPYLLSATAASTYQTQSGMSAYLTTSAASSTYLALSGGTLTGGLAFTGTGNRITGDFSNATVVNRVAFQGVSGATTDVGSIPPTGAAAASFIAFNSTDSSNSAFAQLRIDSGDARFASSKTGTGTYLPMTFYTGGSERVRIDTSGNVGIGTSSPGVKLDVYSSSTTSTVIRARNDTTSVYLDANNGYAYLNTFTAHPLLFGTNNTERARISAAGGFSVGTTADPGAGAIYATGNITAYYSDDRLKTRLGYIENALDKVEQLSGFYYEANETAQALGYKVKREVGVSAQQVQAVLPEIVSPAPIDQQYLTVDYERLVPLLIEAIKELRAELRAMKH